MWRKLLVVILTLLVLGCVGMVVYIALYPDRAHQYAQVAAQKATDEYDRLVRRPPPKPTPEPGTPTPIPTPESTRIARRIRVKPDDFPFGLNNQVVQPDGQIRVTIDIRNRSGREWPTAYLVLSSAYHPEKSHYRIDNWRVGETRSVDYVFPAAEVRERLAELRIENVSSVPVAESLSDIHQGSAGQSEESSGGMLGVWSGFKDAVGVPPPSPEDIAAASTASSPAAAEQVAKGTGIAINLEGLGDVDTTPLPTDGLSGATLEARTAYNAAVVEAQKTVDSMKILGDTLATTPWTEAMAPDGQATKDLEVIKQHMNAFQKQALTIQQLAVSATTAEMGSLVEQLHKASDVILTYQEALERQIRAARPGFTLSI